MGPGGAVSNGASAPPPRPPIHAAPRRVALTVAGALFMEGFDSAVILTSLPQMARDLHESPLRLSVAVTAYLIALAILIPISGWVADRFGPRRVYCTSILVFIAGSLICGLSHTIIALVLGRFVQGMGGSMMSPVGRLILTRGVEKRALVSVMNYMLLPAVVGPTLGPVIGGFITTYASWRWNFFINVPIGLIGLIVAARVIPISPPTPQGPFDWRGFALIGLAAAALQALIEAFGHQLLPVRALAALAALVAICAALYAQHVHRSRAPLIDPALFRIRSFSVAVLAGSLARAGVFSTQILLPTLLQLQFGYSAFHSGLLTFLVSAGAFVARPALSFVLKRFGFRQALFYGCLAAGAMLAGFSRFRVTTPVVLFGAYILAFSIIRSSIFSSMGALALADIEHADMGRSNGVSLFAQRLSMSFGVSFAAASLSLTSAGRTLAQRDFTLAFLFAAAITLIAAVAMLRLRAQDGWQVSGYGAPAHQPPVANPG
jgi:EmrB/QacA subfamily drug resistance transporter